MTPVTRATQQPSLGLLGSPLSSHTREQRDYTIGSSNPSKEAVSVFLSVGNIEQWDSSEPKDNEVAERRMEFGIGWFANPML